MKRFWISWCNTPAMGAFELSSPWWISGESGDGTILVCAAVIAEDELSAKASIVTAYDAPPVSVDWRFCNERADNWSPFCERFSRADWMVWP